MNDVSTLIAVAADSPVERSVVPPRNAAKPTIAAGHNRLPAASLPKTFGWGPHADAEGCLALVPVESARYRELMDDPDVKVVRAMRSSREGMGDDGP